MFFQSPRIFRSGIGTRSARGPVLAIVGIAALLGSTFAGLASAQEATTPNIEATLAVRYDGTSPFSGDPLNDNSGTHTPGRDNGGTNNVVRSFDNIGYAIDWNVNEVATTNLVLTATLPLGTQWLPDPNNLPFRGCLSTGTPASSISADGRTLVCNVGDHAQGEHGQVRPVATMTPTTGVPQVLDGDIIPLQVEFHSDTNPTALTNTVSTTVSATTSWNWVKGAPDVYDNVTRSGVPGRVLVYPLAFRPNGMSRIGSEPVDDSKPIVFWDHAGDLTPSAVLANSSFFTARGSCGGYDGSGSYPYGKAGLGTAVNTTAGVVAGTESIVCTDETAATGNGYPTVKIQISGHNTAQLAPQNAAGDGNYVGVSAQVAFWMPMSELMAKADPSDGVIGNQTGTAGLLNAISGTSAKLTVPAYGQPATVAPIQVASAGGDLDESETPQNTSWFGASFTQGVQDPGGAGGGTSEYVHRARIVQPMQEATIAPDSPLMGTTPAGLDTRPKSGGGIGWTGFGGDWPFAQLGTTPRSQDVTLSFELSTWSTTHLSRQVHGCMTFDNEHMTVKAHPGTITSSAINKGSYDATTLSQSTTTLSDGPFAQVWAGQGTRRFDDPYNTMRVMTVSPYSGVPEKVDYVVEFAASATGFSDSSLQNGTTCNNSDADGRGWVPADQAGPVFDPDGDGIAADINMVRIRTLNNVAWYNVDNLNSEFGVTKPGIQLLVAIPAQVIPDRTINPDGTKIRLHSSRATGAWDPATADAPPSIKCSGIYGPPLDQALGVPPEGWCNRPYDVIGEGTSAGTNVDPNAYTVPGPVGVRDVDSDILTVVEAYPAVSKVDEAGLNHVVDNGDEVTFDLQPYVIGSPQDTVTNIRVTEYPPAELKFVSSVPAPDGFDASGRPYWDFGSQVGGWVGPKIVAKFVVKGAVGDTRLINHVQITADDRTPWDAYAFEFTPPIAAKAAIVKAVDTLSGPCTSHPTEDPMPSGWGDRCSLIELNGDMSFQLTAQNQGNSRLNNYRIIDVLPYNGDGTEASSATGVTGDGRTPASDFTGTATFVSATSTNTGVTFLYTADPSADVNRDPAVSETANTWCDAPINGTAVFGTQANCPTSLAAITAVYAVDSALMPDETLDVHLTMDTEDARCDNVWTNTFGGRTDGLALPIRSNDVSVMPECTYDLASRKVVSPLWSPAADWVTPGTSTVDFAVEVINQGDTVEDFDVTDYIDTTKWEAFDPALNPNGTTMGDATLPYTWDATDPTKPVAKVKGALATGERVVITVRLKVADGWTGTELSNLAEISRFDNNGDASDGDSLPSNPDNPSTGPLLDVDSTPDATNTDPLVDDVIDNSGGDEDDHDIAVVPYLDLALRKRLDYSALAAQNPLGANKTVRFNIEVFNQGSVAANAVSLVDYVDQTMWQPFDVALNPAGTSTGDVALAYTWAAAGTDGTIALTGTLLPGQSTVVPVTLRIRAGADLTELENTAEISAVTAVDADGNPLFYSSGDALGDIDSTPDTTDDDPLTDDVIDNSNGDEDDHDVAAVLYLDGALRKTVNRIVPTTQLPPKPGGTLTFNLEVFNQGTTWIEDLSVTDYIDLTMFDAFDTGLNPNGTTSGDASFPYTWSAAGSNGTVAIDGRLAPGDSIIVPVTLRIAADADVTALVNTAEISTETAVDPDGNPIVDPDGNPVPDIDSIPDTDTGDPEVDDEINNGGGDEDDSDSAFVAYLDLALRKKIDLDAATTQLPTREGGTITFNVEVFNQGNTDATDITLIDYVDQTMWEAFDIADNPAGTSKGDVALAYSWAAAGTNGQLTLTGTLPAGQSTVVPVTLTIRDGANLKTLSNVAEINGESGVDENGDLIVDPDGTPLVDVDSTPDSGNTDPLTDDIIDNSNGDEDDHDIALVHYMDAALRKTVNRTVETTQLPPTAGGTITFNLEIFNQGTTWIEDLTVTDYVDLTMFEAFDSALNTAGTTSGDAAFPYTWESAGSDGIATIDGRLAPGGSIVLPVTLRIAEDADLDHLVNTAEISTETAVEENGDPIVDPDGEPLTDIDSIPDTDTGDPEVDDVIDNSGGDEDDSDSAVVDFLDLALRKTLILDTPTTQLPVHVGGTITFNLEVFNQGNTDAADLELIDYVDQAMWEAFDVADNPAGTSTGDGALAYSWATAGTDGELTITGTLKAHESINIPVTLTVRDGADLNALTNDAEISHEVAVDEDGDPITDPEGTPLTDVDSTPDATDDDPMTDDVIDNSDGDEDDHDIANVHYMDAALRKTVNRAAETTQLPPRQGGTLTFNLEIFNQGTTWIEDLSVTDYVDLTMFDAFDIRLNPAGATSGDETFPYLWNAAGTDGTVVIDGRLAPGDSIVIPVTLRIAADADVKRLLNTAEISTETAVDPDGNPLVDPDGNPIPDIDSIPDTDPGDPEVDDEINNGGGDEDDSDSAFLEFLDLALRKTIKLDAPSTHLPVRVGGTITFNLEVFNQGNTNAAGIALIDYVDQTMWEAFDVADNPAGSTSGALALPYSWEGIGTDGQLTITGTLKPDQSVIVPVTLTIREGADLKALENVAEITDESAVDDEGDEITDADGDPLTDADSTPDDTNDDPLTDDVIDNSNGDEDHHDNAVVPDPETFDLALRKTLDPEKNPEPLVPGGPVTFSIEVFNQGTTYANGITVVDYLPRGLVLADDDWTDNGDGTASINVPGQLAPGKSTVVDISFTIPETATGKFVNTAEISDATPVDADGTPIIDTTTGKPIVDVDSTPDGTDDDDLVDDEINNGGGDEDDHDIAEIKVGYYDLSLVKVVAPGQKPNLVKGDDVTFDITVTNEGVLPISAVSVIDQLPEELSYSDNNTFDWKANGDNSYLLLIEKKLEPGQSASVTMVATVEVDKLDVVVNVAEINQIFGPGGKPVVDIDSTGNNGNEDEDDIGSAPVRLGEELAEVENAAAPQPEQGPGAQSVSESAPGNLALTGGSIAVLVAAAAAMIAIGAALVRRRRANR